MNAVDAAGRGDVKSMPVGTAPTAVAHTLWYMDSGDVFAFRGDDLDASEAGTIEVAPDFHLDAVRPPTPGAPLVLRSTLPAPTNLFFLSEYRIQAGRSWQCRGIFHRERERFVGPYHVAG